MQVLKDIMKEKNWDEEECLHGILHAHKYLKDPLLVAKEQNIIDQEKFNHLLLKRAYKKASIFSLLTEEKIDAKQVRDLCSGKAKELPRSNIESKGFNLLAIADKSTLLAAFDQKRKEDILKNLHHLQKDHHSLTVIDIAKDLTFVLEAFHDIDIKADRVKAELTSHALKALGKAIEYYLDHPKELTDSTIDELLLALCRGVDILWELRTFIENSGSEKSYWTNEVSRANFEKVIHQLPPTKRGEGS